MTYSRDLLDRNPEFAALLEKHAAYRVKADQPVKATDGYDSQLERDYAAELIARGLGYVAHPFTVHLPGGVDYTPDFITWEYSAGMVISLIECKGSMRQRNARDSWTRFRIAAGLFPCFRWTWVQRGRGQWSEKVISHD